MKNRKNDYFANESENDSKKFISVDTALTMVRKNIASEESAANFIHINIVEAYGRIFFTFTFDDEHFWSMSVIFTVKL